MNNTRIRIKMIEAGLKQWQLAQLLNMDESTLSRKLRDELPDDEQKQICDLIEQARGDAHEDR